MTIHNSIFPVLLDLNSKEVPIFIPTFNQPSLIKMTLDQLKDYDGEIIIYDNNSTYQPMLNYLDELSDDFTIVKSNRNNGPRIFTEDIQILNLMPEYFIVTDPDLIYNNNLPSDYITEMKRIIKSNKLSKVGFAIEIEDQDEVSMFQDSSRVLEWEKPYWENIIGQTKTKDLIYDAWIDTTFSLNNRDSCIYHRKFNKPTFRYPSARIGGKYTCRHTGWWKKDLMPQTKEEINYYLNNQQWSHTENYYYK